MANALYGKGRNKFARGEINWLASGGDTIRCFLVDGADYTTPLIDTDEFLSSIPAAGRVGGTGTGYNQGAPLTLIDPALGVCDANDVTMTAVTGDPCEYIVIYKQGPTADTDSPLLALIDSATGLPVTPNGGDITIAWDNGALKIFKL